MSALSSRSHWQIDYVPDFGWTRAVSGQWMFQLQWYGTACSLCFFRDARTQPQHAICWVGNVNANQGLAVRGTVTAWIQLQLQR